MLINSVFDELGLVGNLTTSSRTSHGETPIRKNREKQSMQRIELPKTKWSSHLIESPS
jgi:hypothetical protein